MLIQHDDEQWTTHSLSVLVIIGINDFYHYEIYVCVCVWNGTTWSGNKNKLIYTDVYIQINNEYNNDSLI